VVDLSLFPSPFLTFCFRLPRRTHPHFISIEAYKELIDDTGMMNEVTTSDWVDETIASWRHSIWVGIYDPRGFIFKPHKYLKCVRDAYCLERMHRAFARGLMQYGMFAATKKSGAEK
jgi:MPBQ/MSBQ methyltransferase